MYCCLELVIRSTTQTLPSHAVPQAAPKVQRLRHTAFTMTKKHVIRFGAVGLNIVLLVAVLYFVLGNSSINQSTTQAILNSNNATVNNPLDQLSSADIATSIANMTYIAEATAVKNQAETVNAELAVAPAANVVSHKPQVVAASLKSRADIQTYTVQQGDTLASLASKFNVTSNSLSWSNNNATNLSPGTKLSIPSINGIVYTVKDGDTPQSLASKYNANANQIIAFNDAEIAGLKPGTQIIIPNGKQPAPTARGVAAAANFYPTYGGNGYIFGYCTWYVATQIPVPSNWGNASSWAHYAARSGWTVSSTPRVGAIAQNSYSAGGQGHVAIVEAVSEDGTRIKYRDMNGVAGWSRVGYSDWVTASRYPNYISR